MSTLFSDGFLTLEFLKKFVCFARANCGPRLTASASEKLINHYVRMRNPQREHELTSQYSLVIRFQPYFSIHNCLKLLFVMSFLRFLSEFVHKCQAISILPFRDWQRKTEQHPDHRPSTGSDCPHE